MTGGDGIYGINWGDENVPNRNWRAMTTFGPIPLTPGQNTYITPLFQDLSGNYVQFGQISPVTPYPTTQVTCSVISGRTGSKDITITIEAVNPTK